MTNPFSLIMNNSPKHQNKNNFTISSGPKTKNKYYDKIFNPLILEFHFA